MQEAHFMAMLATRLLLEFGALLLTLMVTLQLRYLMMPISAA